MSPPARAFKEVGDRWLEEVGRTIYGLDEVVRLVLVALFSNGHVLLEGNPGLGKTELVKTLARVLGLQMGRIQFTPDLMPADITGTLLPAEGDVTRLEFKPGPICRAQLLLADEINRATPKTQSAMLEGMAERQVTVLGERHPLLQPFCVLATQNPIDHEGTYDLPEAQSDRFAFKLLVQAPSRDVLRRILVKTAGGGEGGKAPRVSEAPVSTEDLGLPASMAGPDGLHELLHDSIRSVHALGALESHVLNLTLATHGDFASMEDVPRKDRERVKALVEACLTHGLSPRASTALLLGAKAWCLLFEPVRDTALGRGLGHVAVPAIRHRLLLDLDWEHRYRDLSRGDAPSGRPALLTHLARELVRASAPDDAEYRTSLQHGLETAGKA